MNCEQRVKEDGKHTICLCALLPKPVGCQQHFPRSSERRTAHTEKVTWAVTALRVEGECSRFLKPDHDTAHYTKHITTWVAVRNDQMIK